MADLITNTIDCGRFEGLVSDFAENALSPELSAAMRRHASQCAGCATLLEDVRQTLQVLADLPDVAEPPALRPAIFARTISQRKAIGWAETVRALAGQLWQPRLVTAFGMAVFSIAVLLNATGVDLSNLSWRDLQPSQLRMNVTAKAHRTLATGIRYYNDLKVVYQIEAALRQMKQSQDAPEGGPRPSHDRTPSPTNNQVMSGEEILAALHAGSSGQSGPACLGSNRINILFGFVVETRSL
jgi:hypothetical protein